MNRKRASTASSDEAKVSPVRTQWEAIKRQHPGRVLLFQLGDFYETFEADARIVARVCDITLTSRELSKGDRVPLAGVPIHRAAPHIGKLISAGYHVAICDQVSEPGKGLVERQVTRVVTPGTVAEPGLISPHENNLIVALSWGRSGVGLAAADVTTGEVMTTLVDVYVLDADDQPGAALLAAELQRLAPAECLVAEQALFPTPLPGHITPLAPSKFDAGAASDTVRRLYGVSSLDGFGLSADSPALGALGALIGFVGEANYRLLASLREPKPYVVGSHVALDPATRRNLELTRTSRHGHARGSLFHAIDRTRTPMGARRLRRLLGQPLMERSLLDRRLDAVEALAGDGDRRRVVRTTLGRLGDVERLVGRVRQTTATPREVMMLATALRVLPELQGLLGEESPTPQPLHGANIGCVDVPPPCAGEGEQTTGLDESSPYRDGVASAPPHAKTAKTPKPTDIAPSAVRGANIDCVDVSPPRSGFGVGDSSLLASLSSSIDGCPALVEAIEQALAELGGPRLIKPGYSAELDELVEGMAESRKWLAQLERRERERTGIKSLKVGYNKVFGYYLEVTRPNLPNVPSDYQRRQSLVSAERFITPELKERESLILTAEARVDELEGELFQALLRKVSEQARPILRSVEAVADLDVLAALADVAADRNWCRPSFSDDDELTIVGGRHPVLEAMLQGGEIVPNDCLLGGAGMNGTVLDGLSLAGPSWDIADDANDTAMDDPFSHDLPERSRGRLLIVTGPNMGGKSTYLRMVALCVLLAQVGSFVPASEARIGLVDRLFTRVGSEDDLAAGASTFLVEMAETASILRQATLRSLVVLDEVGRGTSTHDGLCIAQAVLEHLHDTIGARTLFATHFHELTALADTLSSVRNVTVAVDERDGQLAFLYRVVPGAADRSYGVQVARLAGLLSDVTDRAALLLREREISDTGPVVLSALDRPTVRRVAEEPAGYDLAPAPLSGAEREEQAEKSAQASQALTNGAVAEEPPVARPILAVAKESSTPLPLPPCAGEGEQMDLAVGAHFIAPATTTETLALANASAITDAPEVIVAPVATDAPDLIDMPAPRPAPLPSPTPTIERNSTPANLLPLSGAERDVDAVDMRAAQRPEGEVNPGPTAVGREVSPATPDVATRMLAEILALDLGNLTPIRALTLLHELQTKAREAVPWSSWMASMAGARDQTEHR